MKKILITIIVFIFGVIVIPTNAEAIIVNDKKITFEEFVLGEGELSIDDDLYSYTLRESDDFSTLKNTLVLRIVIIK